jgi:tRNA pseudouridine55 synthase
VVAKVRRLASQKRVGHAGTLDPMASGVLPVLLGRATRLADFIQQGRKAYSATIQLGAATDTDDAEGTVIREYPIPPLSEDLLREALSKFEGEILQLPPAYSALKIAGQRAYAVARRGEDVNLAPRPVTIHQICLKTWSPTELTLEVTCSKGTYIRALARDIAVALGTVGHLTALVRTQVGSFCLDSAVSLDDIATRGVPATVLPASHAIPEAPTFSATADESLKLLNGQPIPVQIVHAESVWVYDPTGSLVCLASADGTLLRPRLAL